MLTRQEATIKLTVPAHGRDTATAWVMSELDEQPGVVLAVLAEELAVNPELRAFVAGLMGE